MGSRLYSRWEVDQLLDDAGLELLDATHDFVLPYGFYRKIPSQFAAAFWDADLALRRLPYGDRLTSVSFWNCQV
jgi:hypothetical protein